MSPHRSAIGARRMVIGVSLLVAISSTLPPAGARSADGDDPSSRGRFATSHRDVVVPRPRDGGSFEARLYVPMPSHDAVSPDRPLPVVAFGHGYLSSVERYGSTLEHLASWGMLVIAPRSAGELFPSHGAFADDLLTALHWAADAAEADDWTGPPVDADALALVGHSMGGGAAVLAAARDPSVAAVATLAAAETDPSAVEAAARLAAPALFIAADEDAFTPLAAHQRPMAEAKTRGPVDLWVIEGGSHCGFLDAPPLLGLVCDEGSLAPERQLELTRALLTGWLRAALVPDVEPAAGWPEGLASVRVDPLDG